MSKLYPDEQFFLKSLPEDGLHTVQVQDQLVDILIRDRDSDTTVVFFHAAVGREAAYPSLSGEKSTGDVGINLISVADPTIQLSQDIRIGWHIGNRTVGDFPTFMRPLINHAATCLGTTRLILVGASAGGYAAINFGSHFPDSIVLAVNPRLKLNAAPWPDITRMVQVAYGVSGAANIREARDRHMTMDLATIFTAGLPFHLALYQNRDDAHYYKKQYGRFLVSLSDDERLWTRVESDGRGHVPIPSVRLQQILSVLSDTQLPIRTSLVNAGFNNSP